MATPRYYSNGQPWYEEDRPVPNQATKTDDTNYQWWHGQWGNAHAPDDPSNPWYESDPWAIIARREMYRNMGGKPFNASAQQIASWKQDAHFLVLMMSREPCGAFSSRPNKAEWDYRSWAALCNWYFWLDPQSRYAFLQDVSKGMCFRWMPVVLEARKNVPKASWNDPTYANSADELFRIQQTGDDPSRTLGGDPGIAHSKWPTDYVSPCDQWATAGKTPIMCFSGYPSTTSWPIVGADGIPLTIPGLPVPCTPFPQCLAQAIPAAIAPCSPMPECLFGIASQAASFVPGAAVTRTAEGGTYLPLEEGMTVGGTQKPDTSPSWLLPALLALLGAGIVGGAILVLEKKPRPAWPNPVDDDEPSGMYVEFDSRNRPYRLIDTTGMVPDRKAIDAALNARWPGAHISGDWFVTDSGDSWTPIWGA